ncbi:protein kinase domain-containing protein [Planctellipticum variicoloris]|uniref:protein kinase domain-containing protein n=1 Tax=Planctellipticum variicoloris TaxID=3064265 RepID=UPI003013A2BF|nr:protein kinase [Planctomycetaceae bacterium SH412]
MSSSPQTSPAPADLPADLCPQGDRLEAFLAGALASDEAVEFSLHFDECPLCLAAAEARLSKAVWSDVLVEPLPPIDAATGRPEDDTAPNATSVEIGGAAPSTAGRLLADRYELRGTVGMGGCGAVFAAWDRVLRREVAIKSPHWQLGENQSVRRMFVAEARAAARLSHPNIVPVYEARIEDGEECFLVSELIRGPSLLEWLETKWSDGDDVGIRDAALLMAALADGVEFAHKAGVLHRDLKPSNVMLAPTPAGELSFTPRITDFGLAQLSDSATKTTADGGIRGSLPYMAPERFTGSHEIRSPSDVYALGVILYELLTGEAPIQAETPAGLVAAIPVQPIPRLRGRRSDVPRDLEAICLKCLEKLPARRYPSAAALAADLRRFLAGEVVTARLPHAGERAARWIARHPAVAVVMTTIAIAATAFVALLAYANEQKTSLIGKLETSQTELRGSNEQLKTALQTADAMRHQADAMRRQADRMRHMAERQQRATQESLYVSEFRRAMQAWQERDLPAVQRILDALDGPAFAPFRGIECDWLRTKLVRPHRELTRMPGAIYSIAFSHDGELLAAAGKDSVVRLVRYADGVTVREWPTEQREVNRVVFSPDDSRVWTTGDDGTVCQWEVATGKELLRVVAHAPEQAHDLVAPPEEKDLLISTGTDGRVCFWNINTGIERGAMQFHTGSVIGLTYEAKNRRLLTAGRDSKLRIWSIFHKKFLGDTEPPGIPLASAGLRNGGGVIISLQGLKLAFWQPSAHALCLSWGLVDEVKVLIEHPTQPRVYAIDVNGVLYEVAIPAVEDYVVSQTTKTAAAKLITRLHSGRVYAVHISPDQSSLVTCGGDGTVRSWPLETLDPQAITTVAAIPNGGELSGFSSDGLTFGMIDKNGLTEFDSRTLQPVQEYRLTERTIRIKSLRLPDGPLLVLERDAAGWCWLVKYAPPSWAKTWEVRVHGPGNNPHDIGVDAQLGLVVINDFKDRYCQFIFTDSLEQGGPLRLRVAPDHLAISSTASQFALSQEREIVAFESTSRRQIWSQPTPAGIHRLHYSPDGCWLLSVTGDRVIRKWDATSGRFLGEMSGHRSKVNCLSLSADGRTLFTGDDGGEMQFWHLESGELLGKFDYELNGIHEMVLSPSGDRLVTWEHGRQLHSIPLRP